MMKKLVLPLVLLLSVTSASAGLGDFFRGIPSTVKKVPVVGAPVVAGTSAIYGAAYSVASVARSKTCDVATGAYDLAVSATASVVGKKGYIRTSWNDGSSRLKTFVVGPALTVLGIGVTILGAKK